MTHILLVIEAGFTALHWEQDPRTPREVVMAINMGRLRIGDGLFSTPAEQSACALIELDVVVVTYEPPEVVLTERLYQTLWGLADGQSAEELARDLNIKRRTVYLHYARLKECFGVETLAEVLDLADELGLV
jgi:DNA-binding CsgD family transcriptional regulator